MYEAVCHCGKVVVGVARKPRSLTQCNCSICRRYGALWAYYKAESARVLKGKGALAVYRRTPRGLGFHHCKSCGCVMFHRRESTGRMGVNARNFDPEFVAQVRISLLDGDSTWKVLEHSIQPNLFRSPAPPVRRRGRAPGSS